MLSRQICPGLWYIGVLDEKLRIFRNVSYTETGMMYNSYLMDTGDGYILFGSLPVRYVDSWIREAERIAGDSGIRWAVLFGTENDRAAANALLKKSPDTVLIGGTGALYNLDGLAETDFRRIEARSHRTLSIGNRTLRFAVVPDKRDTPSVYVMDRENGILFTADAFGSCYVPSGAGDRLLVSSLSDGEKEEYFKGAERYFEDISGASRRGSLENAAALVRENGIRLICPSCGPLADEEQERLISIFLPPEPERRDNPVLAVIYAPGGYVRELAESIRAGVQESGNITVEMYDLSAINREDVVRKAARADGFLFGTMEAQGDAAKPVWDILTSLKQTDCKGKPAAIFCCAEGPEEVAEKLRRRLSMLGCDLNLQGYCVQGKPDLQTLKNAYEYGFGVGCSLQRIPNPRGPRLMKCLVCGEIFDASLGACPVCGVGLEQCVPVEPDEVDFRNNTDNRYVILGGGIAAVSAAEAIRQRDETGRITMISAESYLPINRPMLTKDLKTAAESPESLAVHGREWYEERKIDLRLGSRAVSMDTQARTVTTDSGERLSYDKLIYAAGAECFVPPFEGWEKEGVLTIRHLTDSRKLADLMKTAKKAVVIGGGVLGLEAASELTRSGLGTTVLEAAPQIIGRQADGDTAAIMRKAMEGMGVACHEGVSIAGIEGEGRVTGVRLGDGRVFPADIVIVSCGNRANVQAAREAGIEVDRAIVVNQYMETGAADVYACGDCAQLDGVNFQLWQEASGQGRVAGANAAGDRLIYANQLLGLSLEGFGASLFAIGDPGKRTDIPYKTVEIHDGVAGRHEKYWFFGGSLQGAVLIGAPEKTAEISKAVTVHARYHELEGVWI